MSIHSRSCLCSVNVRSLSRTQNSLLTEPSICRAGSIELLPNWVSWFNVHSLTEMSLLVNVPSFSRTHKSLLTESPICRSGSINCSFRTHQLITPCWVSLRSFTQTQNPLLLSNRSAVLDPLIAHSALTNPLVLPGSICDHSHKHKILCWLNHRCSCTLANTVHCSVGFSNLWTHVLLHEDLVMQSMIIPTSTKSLADWTANAQCPLRGRHNYLTVVLSPEKGAYPGNSQYPGNSAT